jgi:hypothetical protein
MKSTQPTEAPTTAPVKSTGSVEQSPAGTSAPTEELGSICPLCSRVLSREQLFDHITAEHPRRRHNTIKLIRAYYPGWAEEHGACHPCWKSFRDAGQALDFIKEAKQPGPFTDWHSAAPALHSKSGPHPISSE